MSGLNRLAPVLSIAVLLAVAVVTMARPQAQDAEPYHERVRYAVDNVPRQIEGWLHQRDDRVPEAAQRLLRPNALLSRVYHDLDTGNNATFVIVHTKDARDMIGHFPPACYPRAGWTLESQAPRTWQVDGRTFEGVRYHFVFNRPGQPLHMTVDNLLVLPGGHFARNMGEVIRLASDQTRHFFGSAQIQLITDGRFTEEERDDTFKTIIGANFHLFDALTEMHPRPTPERVASSAP
jgi:hypothetical protein